MAADPPDEFAVLAVQHHLTRQERVEHLRRRPGRKSSKPECIVIGHAWMVDRDREGWVVCLSCEAVRPD